MRGVIVLIAIAPMPDAVRFGKSPFEASSGAERVQLGKVSGCVGARQARCIRYTLAQSASSNETPTEGEDVWTLRRMA